MESPRSGGQRGDFCQHRRDSRRRPVAWGRVQMPCTKARSNRGWEGRVRVNICAALALAPAAPWLHLGQPGAVARRHVPHTAWRLDAPRPAVLAVMGAARLAHERPRLELGDHRHGHRCQPGAACRGTLARGTWPHDEARPGVAGSQDLPGSTALLCRRIAVGNRPRVRGPRRSGGVRLNGPAPRVIRPEPCVEGDERRDGGLTGGLAWGRGRQPELRAPGVEVRAGPPPGGGGGPGRGHPPGAAAAPRRRTFAGEASHGDRDRRGNHPPWPRGQGRRSARPSAAPARGWPPGRPPAAGPPRRVPQRRGSAPWPGGGSCALGAPAPRRRGSTVASVPPSPAPQTTAPGVRMLCGLVPSASPPRQPRGASAEIPARGRTGKPLWIPFHDALD